MRLYLIVLLAGLLGTACASAQAKGSPDTPGLNVPTPPPHEIELPAEPLEPVGEVMAAPPGTSPGTSRSARPAAPKPETAKGTEAKPGETKPENPPAPATNPEPAPPLPPAAPAPQLKTPQTADTSGAAKAVRSTIDRARNTLGAVNFGPLSNERKKAYNDAKLFLQEAEDALKEGNIVYAQAVATKAETLARELAGR